MICVVEYARADELAASNAAAENPNIKPSEIYLFILIILQFIVFDDQSSHMTTSVLPAAVKNTVKQAGE